MIHVQYRNPEGVMFWVKAPNRGAADTAAALASPQGATYVRHQTASPTSGDIYNTAGKLIDSAGNLITENNGLPNLEAAAEPLAMAAPQAAFRRFLGTLGYDPLAVRPGLRQQAAQAAFDPISSAFLGQQILEQGLTDDPDQQRMAMERFLADQFDVSKTKGQIPGYTGTQFANLLSGFGRIPVAEEGGTGYVPYQQQAIRPLTVGQGRPLASLGLNAIRQSISPLALRYFDMPSEEELATRYLAQDEATRAKSKYEEFIKNQLGLGRLGEMATRTTPSALQSSFMAAPVMA